MLVKPGQYKAWVVDKAITKAKTGNYQAVITFEFEVDGSRKTMNYYGSLYGGAIDYTIKALLYCGLKGNNPAGEITKGKEVSIVIDTDEDNQGKDYSKISWVNPLVSIKNVVPQDEALMQLAGLEGAIMRLRSEEKIDDDEIPF